MTHIPAAIAAAHIARNERNLARITALEAEVVALTARLAIAQRCARRLDARNAELRRERDRLEAEAAPGAGAPRWLPEPRPGDVCPHGGRHADGWGRTRPVTEGDVQ